MAKQKKEQPKTLGIMTGTEALKPGGIPRTRRKVAIVGFATSSMLQARSCFDDPDFEIWGLNQLYVSFPMMAKKATRWFQLHHASSYDQAVRDHKHGEWLAEQKNFPIYMQEHTDNIPMSVAFPRDEMVKKFVPYFTNSISWELALAIHEGFECIHIYGVDMAQNEEYIDQRPSVELFIGWARGMGIKVKIPGSSDLLKAMWLYPFEDDHSMIERMDGRRRELRDRMGQLAGNEQQMRDQRMQLAGALENMNYIERNWRNTRKEMGAGAEENR